MKGQPRNSFSIFRPISVRRKRKGSFRRIKGIRLICLREGRSGLGRMRRGNRKKALALSLRRTKEKVRSRLRLRRKGLQSRS